MKKKSIIAFLLILTLSAAVFMTACGGGTSEPQTLEDYAKNNEDIQQSIDSAATDSNVVVEIKGNDIIYTFDLANMEEYTDELVHNEQVVENLQNALDQSGSTFEGIARSVQDATGIQGIRTIVNYVYGDETIATQTFEASEDTTDNTDNTDSKSAEESEDTAN